MYRPTERIALTQTNMRAQLSAFVPVAFIFCMWQLTILFHGFGFMENIDNVWTLICLGFVLLSFIPHEYLHAAGWMIKGKKRDELIIKSKGLKGASIEFKGTMSVSDYMFGSMFPFYVLSLIPLICGIVLGNFQLLLYGSFMGMGCGSDLMLCIRCLPYLNRKCEDPGNITGIVILPLEEENK